MAIIKILKLVNFRNFSELSLCLGPHINILLGRNGVGKSSILEAIQLSATGKSTRSNIVARAIKFNQNEFLIKIDLQLYNNLIATISYKRDLKGERQILLNSKEAKSVVEIAAVLPICYMDSNSFNILSGPPQERRKLFDWGLFHVEHEFINIWKRYNNILKQRNSLLKKHKQQKFYDSWDNLFISHVLDLCNFRQKHFILLEPLFYFYLQILWPGYVQSYNKILIKLDHGLGDLKFDTSEDFKLKLKQKLKDSLSLDIMRNYTSLGPHRADLLFTINNIKAKEVLSRGQEKLIIIALYLAQLAIIRKEAKKNTTILMDDLAGELDKQALSKIYNQLLNLDHQLIITAIDIDHIPEELNIQSNQACLEKIKLFHVEQLS